MIRFYGDALEADLRRYYLVDLVDMYAGLISVRRVSIYAKYLPRGANVFAMHGGAMAITEEVDELWSVQTLLQWLLYQNGGNKGPKPKRPDYPKGIAEMKRRADRNDRRAAAWRAKYLDKQ